MAKFGTGERYTSGLLYGPDPQYLSGVGNIPSTAAPGMLTVTPGPVTIPGVGDIPGAEAFGIPWIFLIPERLALGVNIRRLSVTPQIRRLQVTPNG